MRLTLLNLSSLRDHFVGIIKNVVHADLRLYYFFFALRAKDPAVLEAGD